MAELETVWQPARIPVGKLSGKDRGDYRRLDKEQTLESGRVRSSRPGAGALTVPAGHTSLLRLPRSPQDPREISPGPGGPPHNHEPGPGEMLD